MVCRVCKEGLKGYPTKGMVSMYFGEERMGANMRRRDTERKHCYYSLLPLAKDLISFLA